MCVFNKSSMNFLLKIYSGWLSLRVTRDIRQRVKGGNN